MIVIVCFVVLITFIVVAIVVTVTKALFLIRNESQLVKIEIEKRYFDICSKVERLISTQVAINTRTRHANVLEETSKVNEMILSQKEFLEKRIEDLENRLKNRLYLFVVVSSFILNYARRSINDQCRGMCKSLNELTTLYHELVQAIDNLQAQLNRYKDASLYPEPEERRRNVETHIRRMEKFFSQNVPKGFFKLHQSRGIIARKQVIED